jgi:predicted nuclease of restriction endonuclease-like (RecB) superfamily
MNQGSSSMEEGLEDLLDQVRKIILSARKKIHQGVNAVHVRTCYWIGFLIVEHEQKGAGRARYGDESIRRMSISLTEEFGDGFSERNLRNMRGFNLGWKGLFDDGRFLKGIQQTTSAESPSSGPDHVLSWSHYVFLMGIKNIEERMFYDIESKNNDWSLRELKRQFESSLYERLALSRDKEAVRNMSRKGQVVERAQDMFKEPFVLEFLGLKEDRGYSEREMETAIIDKLEHFLLELGRGFLFEARQKRFTFDSDHFFVDLVFYNRILRCYVLLDLKIGKLTHQDIGQMQMYVNYYDRFVRMEHENPAIGIILCKEKNEAVVKLTLPKERNIYPVRYQLCLPSKKELQRKMIEWSLEGEILKKKVLPDPRQDGRDRPEGMRDLGPDISPASPDDGQ